MDTILIAEMEAAFRSEVHLAGEDLSTLERAARDRLRVWGRALLQRLVDHASHQESSAPWPCSCGGQFHLQGYRPRQIQTLLGVVTIRRAYFRCPACGASRIPYDQASGLGSSQISPGLARACSVLAAEESFASTSRKVEDLTGQRVSPKTVERVAEQVGTAALAQQEAAWKQYQQTHEPPAEEQTPARLYIAVDGTTVHEQEGWHESKVAAESWEDSRQKRQVRYVGRFSDSESFGQQVWAQACRWGFRTAPEVVYLGDGAGWIRTLQHQWFSRATFIIDWYHASEHVWDCSKVLYGEGTQATERWVKRKLDLLWAGQTRPLLVELDRQVRPSRGVKRKALMTLHRYIADHEDQMQYDRFQARGYRIGSGEVEGACKHLVGRRLKQSGMIWSRRGSSSILALRIAWLNQEWDTLWQSKPLQFICPAA
jgi:hypothetical protein